MIPAITGVGQSVFLESKSGDRKASEIAAALAERFETQTTEDTAGTTIHIFLASAVDPNEAVVKLACALDEIDPAWERTFSWPRAGRGDPGA